MNTLEIAPGVYTIPDRGVNVYFIKSGQNWALIDAGWPGDFNIIKSASETIFGQIKPCAIYLTHAHPDHIGAAKELSEYWAVPVFMHENEIPIACGDFNYISKFPIPMDTFVILPILRMMGKKKREAVMQKGSLEKSARPLPEGPGLPDLPDWQWVFTPGHSVGHVAFFRESDRVLISGDGLLTAACGGLFKFIKKPGLPLYIASWNWEKTKESAKLLAGLKPRVLASGHGHVIYS